MAILQTEADLLSDAAGAYPSSEAAWSQRYEMLWNAYVGGDYSAALIKLWHLFRALDDANEEIDATYRVTRDFQFLVNTYGASVAGIYPGPVLETAERAPSGLLEAGESVWRRSRVRTKVGGWGRITGAMGDGFWESVRMSGTKPHGTTLVYYDPRNCRVSYDRTQTRIDRAVIEMQIAPGEAMPTTAGVNDTPQVVNYKRVLTRDRIIVTYDGQEREEEGGEHKLGVVPITHAQWSPWTEPEHGLPVGHPLDRALAMIDSVLCMARAVGNRHAAPILYLKGNKLATNDVGKIGRIYHGLKVDSEMGVIEPTMDGVARMLEVARDIWQHVHNTEPAYIFSGEGSAAESGEARGYRSTAFESLVHDVRTRFYGAITEATAMACAMDEGRAHEPDAEMFVPDLPPVLPRNVAAAVKTYVEIRADLRPADRVRQLQSLGLIPADQDPDEYAEAVADETGEGPAGVGSEEADRRGAEIETAAEELRAMAEETPEYAERLRKIAMKVMPMKREETE